jgi:serine/threonine protein kinase/tetratricopeptide (TPR) repeat protein
MSLGSGTCLGPYEITVPLGAGGMGEVYRARDTRLGRDVAIKVLPAEFASDPERLKRFEREAKATAALSHPNILDVHDVGTHEGTPYLVEELLEGESLKARIGRGAIPVVEAVGIAAQVAHGLAAAHGKNIVHRDLKPENVFLTAEGTVKILDFGLAKLVESVPPGEADTLTHAPTGATEAGRVLGTVAYMAPEQARGMPVDQRADVFAFGVVLYEMLSGQRPFRGATATDTLAAIIKDEPAPLPATVPPQLAAVVERCLAKEPAHRYQRGGEVEAALEAVRSEGPISLSVSLKHSIRRRPWLVAANVVAALLVLTLVLDAGGVRKRLLGTAATGRIDSLAVLPLENLSGDPEQEYLAAGMHDALITNLGQVAGLKRVIARGSVLRFKGTSEPPKEIARELGVSGLITGAVLRSGDRVRVTAQLIDPATQAQVWAHSYEASLRDVLSLENDIVTAITREIKVALTPQEKTRLATARPVNPEAFEAYLKAMFYLYKKTPEAYAKGMALLEGAIQKNPTAPLPYAGLALAYPILYHGPAGTVPPNEGFPKARAAALKALELDDSLAQAHLALATIKIYHDWDWAGAESEFKRALELNPNLPEAHAHYCWYLSLFGRNDEAITEGKRAVELDPLTPVFTAWVGWLYWDLQDYDRAIEWAHKALELDPNDTDGLYVLAGALGGKQMFEQAIETGKKLAAVNPDWKFGLAEAYATAERRDDALNLVAEMEREDYPRFAIFLYGIQQVLGNKEETFRALDAAFQYHHIFLPWFFYDDSWFPWRSDPRWQEYRRRFKFPGEAKS